jgi:hypothetical protein
VGWEDEKYEGDATMLSLSVDGIMYEETLTNEDDKHASTFPPLFMFLYLINSSRSQRGSTIGSSRIGYKAT